MLVFARPLPIWKICIAILLSVAGTTWCNVWFFRQPMVQQVQTHSSGIITTTLLANLLLILLVLVLVLRMGFGVRFRDMGLCPSNLASGLKDTAMLWLGAQMLCLIVQLVEFGHIELRSDLSLSWSAARIGELIGQLFGNAFFEEVFFRGVLFSQLIVWFQRKFPTRWVEGSVDENYSAQRNSKLSIKVSPSVVWSAAIVSGTVFSLQHIPNRLIHGAFLGSLSLEIVALTVAGIFFALLYWRTKNMWTTIAFHAMVNSFFYPWNSSTWTHAVAMTVLGTTLLVRSPKL